MEVIIILCLLDLIYRIQLLLVGRGATSHLMCSLSIAVVIAIYATGFLSELHAFILCAMIPLPFLIYSLKQRIRIVGM